MNDMNNEKNKSSVILNPERSEWVSRSHVTSVESVVNDGVKTKPHHALRRSLRALAYGSTLKMTEKAQSFLSRCCASVTCFMKLPRRIQRMLLVMTFPALALIFTIITTSKSSAETWNCGELDKQGNYGNNVQCTLENGVFTVTGNGNMSGYSITTNWLTTAPWKDYQNQITEIKIADGVTSIGALAMYDILSVSKITIPSGVTSIGQGALAGNKLKSVEIPDTVVRIEVNAFETNLLETINIPDSVKYINGKAFDNNPTLQEIYISDNIDTSNWDISAFDDIRSTPNIICQGEKSTCLIKMQKFIDAGSITEEQIIQAVEGECNSVQYYDGRKCKKVLKDGSKPCANGFKRNEAYCNRILWAPAEAAEVLRDDNNNSVTITFKK